MGQRNHKAPNLRNGHTPVTPLLNCKLHLPLPDGLDNDESTSADVRSLRESIAMFLESGLSHPAFLSEQLSTSASGFTSVTARLSHKQRAYDDYFDVERCQGGSSVTLQSMIPVLGGLKAELDAGSSLSDDDMAGLVDGLQALLETLGES